MERTSLAQIGERAGFSRGIVNFHFGTKAALVERLVNESQRAFATGLSQTGTRSGLDELLALVDAYVRQIGRPAPRFRAFLVMWAEAAGTARELRPVFVEGDRRFRAGIRRLVERGIADGSIRANADPAAVAAALVAQLRGLGVELVIDPKAFRLPSLRAAIVETVRAGLSP